MAARKAWHADPVIDLRPWSRMDVVRRLGGGNRNDVFAVHGAERFVARRTSRTAAALDWELDLMAFLDAHGFRVPVTVPSADGSRSVNGVVVQTWLEGDGPRGADWHLVAGELTRLHQVTTGWPQRPGFASTRDLIHEQRGGDVDLTVMPHAAVTACRAAWRAIDDGPMAVVHGDPGEPNIRMHTGRVGLLDWDESRVDHVELDLADLPSDGLVGDRLRVARTAADAWEAANGWVLEPACAPHRLDRFHAGQGR